MQDSKRTLQQVYSRQTGTRKKLFCAFAVMLILPVSTGRIPFTQSYFYSEGKAEQITMTVTNQFNKIDCHADLFLIPEAQSGSGMELFTAEAANDPKGISLPIFRNILLVIEWKDGYNAGGDGLGHHCRYMRGYPRM